MEHKKLFYIANVRFPTERAHGIQVAKMCEAVARLGVQVTLLVPDRETFSDDPFSYYGIERNFKIEKVPVPDFVPLGKIGFLVESWLFARKAVQRIQQQPGSMVYTREELPLLFLPNQTAFFEAHQLRRGYFSRRILCRAKGIIAITSGLRNALVQSGLAKQAVLVAPDGYDEKVFSVHADKLEARRRLSLPLDATIAMYIGGLEVWKGAETLCKAATLLARDHILVAIIGGTNNEIEAFQKSYPTVRFLGSRPYRELPMNQQAANVLVVPNSMKSDIGSIFTSPLKLFAHMASGIALVVARVPALEEIVGPTQMFPFIPDDPHNLAEVIRKALSPESLPEWASKALEAGKRVIDFTWDRRAKNVLAYMDSLCQPPKKSL